MAQLAMRFMPYRFFWFTTHSWRYMQGNHEAFKDGFWFAWRKFNRLCLIDMGKIRSCEDD